MKRIKNTLFPILTMLAFGILVTSCKDDFTEEDLLEQQKELSDEQAAENAAAIALASSLLDYTVNLHEDNKPIAGATVSVTNQADGTVITATTDANGNAVFVDIKLGGHNVAVSAENISDFSYLVDFGKPVEGVHYQNINERIVPIESSEASKIEGFIVDGESTATIKGVVSIETDLTNSTSEVPQDITIRANLDAEVNAEHSGLESSGGGSFGSIYVLGSFTFTQGNIGVAVVDNTTGEYSMQVPAGTDGTTVELLIPLVEADQTLGWSYENGNFIGPTFGTQPAIFGPDITTAGVPVVDGVTASFTEVPPPGRGVTLNNFTRAPRQFPSAGFDFNLVNAFPYVNNLRQFRIDGTFGSYDFKNTPIATIEDPIEGDTPEINTQMYWELQSGFRYEILTGGKYGLQSNVEVYADFIDDQDAVRDSELIDVVPAGLSGSLPLGIRNGDGALNIEPDYLVTEVRIRFVPLGAETTPATGVDLGNGSIINFSMLETNSLYNSNPSVTFSEVNASGHPAINISLGFLYDFELDNSGNSQSYVIPPTITYRVQKPDNTFTSKEIIFVGSGDVDNFNFLAFVSMTSANFYKVTDGNLQFTTPITQGTDLLLRTNFHHIGNNPPEVLVVEPEHEQASATVNVQDGKVLGLANIKPGSGYTSEVELTLNAAQGTGASIALTDFTTVPNTGEVIWDGSSTLLDGGAGYSDTANTAAENFTAETSVNIKNGETKIVNINYGTGSTVADIQAPL